MKQVPLFLALILSLIFEMPVVFAGNCDGPDIHKITRPIDPTHPKSGNFEFRYRMVRAKDSKSPVVVIYLHGGPGIPSIGLMGPKIGNFSLIQTDIRGVGCNHLSSHDLPDMAFRSDWVASDIVALIQDAGLKDYVLYGLSYGTLLGTEVANLIKQTPNIPLPKAIVFEGTIGRHFGEGENLRESTRQWEQIKLHLEPQVVEELSKEDPVGYSGDTWGSFISTYLDLGSAGSFRSSFEALLGFANPHAHEDLKDELKQTLKSYDHNIEPLGLERAFRLIVCREIADDHSGAALHLKLHRGNLEVRKPHFCGELNMTAPFDSKNFPVQSDLFYFQGDQDPSTPIDSAYYHFENQKLSPHKIFVKIKKGGHFPLSRDLGDCKEQLWDQIVHQNQEGFIQALSKCKTYPNIEVKQILSPEPLTRQLSGTKIKSK
jgi:pimeloyl-ACP methyl ester carboxylesterase